MATAEDVDGFTYEKALEWLTDHDVDQNKYEDLETLEELVRLIKSLASTSARETGVSDNNGPTSAAIPKTQALMKHILDQDRQMKEELTQIYHALIKFMESDINDEIRETIECKFGDYKERIALYQSELSNYKCPIVVAGEISAGKSSLLNLIIGKEILPYSLLCATSTICRLHNDTKMRFEVDGQEVVIDDHGANPTEALKEKLKPFVSGQESRENEAKLVDIFWPIPMLPRNVTIVDTPGFGESEEMNERLMKYLPNAVAFIYVINSATAGGIQEDKLLHILNTQKEWDGDIQLFSFDYKCILFVCNKWDQVEKAGKEEEDKVWKDTQLKLNVILPDIPDGHIFKMCTTEALRYQKSGLGNTEKFEKLLQGIEKLVPQSLKTKVDRHYRWLEKFIGQLQTIINSRIAHAQATEEEKAKLHEAVSARLNKLKMDSERVKTTLIDKAKEQCDGIVTTLHDYLHTDTVQAQLLDWTDDEAPDVITEFAVARYNAEQKIRARIQDVLKRWEAENKLLERLSEQLTTIFTTECRLLGQKCKDIDLMIEGVSDNAAFETDDANSSKAKSKLFTGSERIILLIAAPLWVPLVAAASIVFFPVGIGMMVREKMKQTSRKKEYMANKATFMVQWTKEIIAKSFTKDSLQRFIRDAYFERFKSKIDDLCSVYIPKQIELDQKMINVINEDRRTSHEILGSFIPIQKRLKVVLGQLYMYRLCYKTEELVDSSQIEKHGKLGTGSYSDVYEAYWTVEGARKKIALKELRFELRGSNMYTQLKEVDSLRSLKHPHIVEFLGVTYDGGSGQSETGSEDVNKTRTSIGGKLMLLFEYCEDSLENMVFNNPNLRCCVYNNVQARKEAFDFYVTMATGVCGGLTYMHGQKYMHRDLKLANILVKDGNIPKICDLGFAKEEFISSGTFVGTVTHMSPELFNGKHYTHKTDLYSLGILLWELWYGRQAFSEPEFARYQGTQLLDVIATGARPTTTLKFAMTQDVKEIVESCWHKDPAKRMDAADVSVRLKEALAKSTDAVTNR